MRWPLAAGRCASEQTENACLARHLTNLSSEGACFCCPTVGPGTVQLERLTKTLAHDTPQSCACVCVRVWRSAFTNHDDDDSVPDSLSEHCCTVLWAHLQVRQDGAITNNPPILHINVYRRISCARCFVFLDVASSLARSLREERRSGAT